LRIVSHASSAFTRSTAKKAHALVMALDRLDANAAIG